MENRDEKLFKLIRQEGLFDKNVIFLCGCATRRI